MKQQKGFTLIELLVVIVIIGVLSGIVIVGVGDAIQRARMARSQVFSRTIHSRIGMDLSGWWSFENNALDRSGWRNDGTIMDGAVVHPAPVFEPGVFGNALRFDGSNDFVNVTSSASLKIINEFTIEIWVRPDVRTLDWQRVLEKGRWTADSSRFSYRILGGNEAGLGRRFFRFDLAGGGVANSVSFFTTSPGATVGQWYHLVGIYSRSGNFMRAYTNGVRVSSITPTVIFNGTDTDPLIIGGPSPGGGHFHGLIDEVRIYRAAMPTSYIQKRYVQGIKGLASNGGITQEEKQERLAVLRNSDHLAIDLDSALAGNIDFSQYTKYLVFEK